MKKFGSLIITLWLALLILQACGDNVNTISDDEPENVIPAPWDLVEEGQDPLPTKHSYNNDAINLAIDSAYLAMNAFDEDIDEGPIPDPDNGSLAKYGTIGKLHEAFNESNKYQYAAGERIGISPITSLADAYFTKRPLVKIESNSLYTIEPLTHSMPYLVPEAASLLQQIGRNFNDSLVARNKPGHRFRVTSVLRSAHSVKKLRRVNSNATDSSTHQLGTTFDIAYSRFDHDESAKPVSDEELKYILAEVLRDLRFDNKCLVKYEIKSHCFHITATGR